MHPFVRCCLALGAAVVGMAAAPSPSTEPESSVMLSVKSSPEARLESQIVLAGSLAADRLFDGAVFRPNAAAPAADAYVTVRAGGTVRRYEADRTGYLFDAETGGGYELRREARRELRHRIRQLRAVHYGELLPWERVDAMVPRRAIVRVVDLETGLSFRVQRRAGSSHADVQPLSKADTAVMKRIYSGKWSWKRRAIVVQTGDRRLAASMHGMPHGGDGIPNNGFAGHFCIHFPESATHGSGQVDFEHQLMVHKAGGTLADFIGGARPHEVVDAFFIALKLRDAQLLQTVFANARHEQLRLFLGPEAPNIRPAAPTKPQDASDRLALELPVDVAVIRNSRSAKTTFTFELKRLSPASPWKIDSIDMNRRIETPP